ncbi:hypothetical protein O181_091355 [Austropuccinia psidii MF-1]|uniref:Uncharacterized protein n=1 Tax=Austropuccinia psidii MF-1 TaxID=1389203 RepID=A0A9Q3IWN3_9BASI|nr:hypothetical protein [Austropuccinia psidii MF-1]
MIRRFCAYGLELKDSDGFTHDLCTLIRALELAYKTSIPASTGKAPEILEKGWSLKLPVDTLKKDLVDIHPTASRFNLLLDKVRHHANQRMNDALKYANVTWWNVIYSMPVLVALSTGLKAFLARAPCAEVWQTAL